MKIQHKKWKFNVRKYILKCNMKLSVTKQNFFIVPKAPTVTYEIL
jgi:hypothetical protein